MNTPEILAIDRALDALRLDEGDARPFPSAAALRLEAELRQERQRAARRARILFGVHAGAVAASVALLAAARVIETGPAGSAYGEAGTACAIVIVLVSIWNLFRTADEIAIPS
jgi:hypothetical protein